MNDDGWTGFRKLTSHAHVTYIGIVTGFNLSKVNIIKNFQYWLYGCVFTSHLRADVLLCIPSAERAVGDGERMLDVLQRWGQHRAEVRFFLRHNRAPSRESGKCPSPTLSPTTHTTDTEADTNGFYSHFSHIRVMVWNSVLGEKTFDTNIVNSRDAFSL